MIFKSPSYLLVSYRIFTFRRNLRCEEQGLQSISTLYLKVINKFEMKIGRRVASLAGLRRLKSWVSRITCSSGLPYAKQQACPGSLSATSFNLRRAWVRWRRRRQTVLKLSYLLCIIIWIILQRLKFKNSWRKALVFQSFTDV